MITNMKILKNMLKEKGIKPTYQRMKILEYMGNKLNNHPTVEMVYEELLKDIPTLSLTTVYNTLNNFLEKGLVLGVNITGTEARYDFDTKYHHHFLCKKCGQIIDIDIKSAYAEKEKRTVSGHRIDEVHVYFKGLCKDCSQSEGKKSGGRSYS
jgi:Fur family peroxide stress response transcriptional regulator